MLAPALIRPRRSVGVLLYPFVLGLVFAAAAALAHRAGTAWSPKPSWEPRTRAAPVGQLPDRDMRAAGCAERLSSGLGVRVIASSEHRADARPGPADTVTLRLSGWEHAGDALPIPAAPAQFRLEQTIPGFAQGVGLMSVGDRWMLCVPPELAYKGRPGAPSGMLVFDVELLAIQR
jgi:peptidylprolyl isomerase